MADFAFKMIVLAEIKKKKKKHGLNRKEKSKEREKLGSYFKRVGDTGGYNYLSINMSLKFQYIRSVFQKLKSVTTKWFFITYIHIF